jgi:hypothetical protein
MKRAIISAAAGILGFVIAFGVWHLYIDHKALHEVFAIVAAAQQRAQPAGEAK